MDNIGKLIESRQKMFESQQNQMIATWRPHINAVNAYYQKAEGRDLTLHEQRNIAQCLSNAVDNVQLSGQSRIIEATQEQNIAFLGVQLPVISALLPSLALNEIGIVQALDRRIGSVFYLDAKYGTTKGRVTSGDTMIDAKTGHARANESQRMYAMALVRDEALENSSGMTAETIAATLDFAGSTGAAIRCDKAIIVRTLAGTIVAQSDGSTTYNNKSTAEGTQATLAAVGSSGISGTVTEAGVVALTSTGATTVDSSGLFVTYQYRYDEVDDASGNKTGVPEVNISLHQETMEAIDFPLKSLYSLGASLDLQKAHSINLENEIVKYLGGEIKFTIDHYGIDLIKTAAEDTTNAASKCTDWNAGIGTGQEWLWKKYELLDRIEEGSNNIFSKTLRGTASFILCGNNAARVFKQLTPNFKAASTPSTPTGPMKIGTLDGRPVIQDPFLSTNNYYLGFKGDNYLNAGFVYAPYIPLFATPTLMTADLYAQKGFLSAAGFKVINPGLYTYGSITNLGSTSASLLT